MTKSVFNNDNFVDQVRFAGRNLSLFDVQDNKSLCASEISKCIRYLVVSRVKNNRAFVAREKINLVFNNYLKNIWVERLGRQDDFIIEGRDLKFYDCSINISCCVDAIVRINQYPFVFLFRYLGGDKFLTVKNKGVFKRDLIDMNCCLFLSQIYDGIIVYQHKDPLIYHVKREQKIYDAVISKCRKINRMVASKNIPALCDNFKDKMCYKYCV